MPALPAHPTELSFTPIFSQHSLWNTKLNPYSWSTLKSTIGDATKDAHCVTINMKGINKLRVYPMFSTLVKPLPIYQSTHALYQSTVVLLWCVSSGWHASGYPKTYSSLPPKSCVRFSRLRRSTWPGGVVTRL